MSGSYGLFSPLREGGEDTFLTSLAAIFRAIGTAPALLEAASAAAVTAKGQGGNRGNGEKFQAALAAELNQDRQRAIEAHAQDVLGETGAGAFEPVVGITWRELTGTRAPADFVVLLRTRNGGMMEIPVNVKHHGDTAHSADRHDACALRTLIRTARGEGPESTAAVNVPRTALRWMAGRERIAPGDYYLMVVEGDKEAGTVSGIHFQGMLSAVHADGELAMQLHTTRPETVQFYRVDGLLADDADVNAAFARRLAASTGGADDVKLAIAAFLMRGGLSGQDLKTAAGQLDDMSDAQLARKLQQLLT